MQETKKLKRAALVLGGVTGVLLLIFLIQVIRITWILAGLEPYPFDETTVSIGISNVVYNFIVIATLIITLTMFISIWREESPFRQGIVNRLRIIAFLLVVFEIYWFVSQRIHPIYIDMEEGYRMVIYTPLHGYVLVAGLVAYCVSLILHHGITLQTQVDETL